jgi:hypothetical protein
MNWWHRFVHLVTGHFRRKRGKLLLQLFPDIAKMRIVDVGGSRHFWEKVDLQIPPQNVRIFNISEAETRAVGQGRYEGVQVERFDGFNLPLKTHSVDLVVCNSVIEHVSPESRSRFAKEVDSVARNAFVQTPAWSFPVEPHFVMPFIHWLPRSVGFALAHVSIWRILSRPSRETIRNYWWGTKLLKEREFKSLFPGYMFVGERFFGLTKSMALVKQGEEVRVPR